MAEYIKREKILELINSFKRNDVTKHVVDYAAGWNEALEQIESSVAEDIPAADARPERHGVWEWSKLPNGYNDFKCSACGAREVTTITPHSWTKDGYHEYCGVCGAKMDGGKNNEID